MTMWTETIPVAEAADKLIELVKAIRSLDAQFEAINTGKAAIYREAKRIGFDKRAVKIIANAPSVNDDEKMLRKYLELLVGDEAASAMRDAGHFGSILFGQADSWPTDYVDPKHGPEGFTRG